MNRELVLDATVSTKSRVEVRGGRVRSTRSSAWVEIGTEPVIVGRNAACQLVLDDGDRVIDLIAAHRCIDVDGLPPVAAHVTTIGRERVLDAADELDLIPVETTTKIALAEQSAIFEDGLDQHGDESQ